MADPFIIAELNTYDLLKYVTINNTTELECFQIQWIEINSDGT